MTSTPRPAAVMWFRRDLRLADNPALAAALAEGTVTPLFVLDPGLLRGAGGPRLAFMFRCLRALDESLGGTLVVRAGDPVSVVPAVAREVGASAVFAAGDFAPYGVARDRGVADALRDVGATLRLVGSPYAVDPGTVRKDNGTQYLVFTPFSKVWLQHGWAAPIVAPSPASMRLRGAPEIAGQPIPADPELTATLPPAGERGAWDRWEAFAADALSRYRDDRNRPDLEGCSRMSPYLRFGVVHPRQLLAELRPDKHHDHYRSELCWREFYADVLFHQPHTAWRNLQSKMDALPLDTDARATARFRAWCEGRTGFPIVDAGMRQLLATGWMHNRVRMIVASFLVKDLHLPWQWGARFFMQHLVDGDLASNNHGWQWTAGTGTDAAPYFRVFNPDMQAEKFDPDGAYRRAWVPELADAVGYPAPMVDHAVEREEALARYKRVTGK